MTDGARQGRPGMSTAEFCIAPEGAIYQNYIARVIHLANVIRDFGERRRVRETAAIGFQQKAERRLTWLLRGESTRIVRKISGQGYGSAGHLIAHSKCFSRMYFHPGELLGHPFQHA